MTLQKIRTKSTGHLTSLERDSFANLVDQSNSNFRVKAGSVVDVSLEALDPGAIVYNEADGKMYFCDDEWWNPAGVPIKLKVVYTDTQFAFKFKAPSTSTLNIYDGDGTLTAVAWNDATLVTHTTSYATPGTYYFYVEGDYVDLTWLEARQQSFVSGDVSRFSELTNLTKLMVDDSSVSGDISEWGALTSLTDLRVMWSSVTGDITGWNTLVNLITLNVQGTALTGDVSGFYTMSSCTSFRVYRTSVTFDSVQTWVAPTYAGPAIGNSLMLADCGMTASMVDNMIQSFVGLQNIFISIGGTNGSRTAASNTALATILTRNILITVNESAPVGSLGPELHTDANAMSDPNSNEANATMGWTPAGLTGTGSNVFESQGAVKDTGSYALHGNANDTPTSGAGFSKTFTVDASSLYQLKFKWRHVGVGLDWGCYMDGSFRGINLWETYLTFREETIYFPSTDTSYIVSFREGNASNSGGCYTDNLSLKKVTLP